MPRAEAFRAGPVALRPVRCRPGWPGACGPSGRRGLLSAIAPAVFAFTALTMVCVTARAQEVQDEVASEFPEGAPKATVAGVTVEPGDVEAGDLEVGVGGKRILLLGAEIRQVPDKKDGRIVKRERELHIGKSFSEGVKSAAARTGTRPTAGAREAKRSKLPRRRVGWDIGGRETVTTPLATLRLTQLESKLDLACQKTVTAGEPIKLYLKSTGGADLKWRVCLVHPGRSGIRWDIEAPYTGAIRYGCREIMAGKEILGGKIAKIKVLLFETYPADRGKLLGILIEKPDYTEFQHTFWVKVE